MVHRLGGNRQRKLQYQVDHKEDIYIWTTEKTVGDVLEEADIELSEFDKVSPSLDAQLKENSSISVEKAYDFTLIDGKDKKKLLVNFDYGR